MLYELCKALRNWFEREIIPGTFSVTDGVLTGEGIDLAAHLQENQWFRLEGSVFNNGVHKYGEAVLMDEAPFDGAIWAMAVPSAVIALAADIEAWQGKYGGADASAMSPYMSESFGGYTYTKSAGSGTTWQQAFASRMNQWRKI